MIKRMPNWVLGLIVAILIAVGSFFAFTKANPFANPYEVKATFRTAQNVRVDSPVRVAGVDVGTVTAVEALPTAQAEELAADGTGEDSSNQDTTTATVVTMEIEDEALPIKEDATFSLEPRLFLEGNLLVNVKPGSPSAPEVPSGHVFPINQSSVSVQLDQILTTLQSDVRVDLQDTLKTFANTFIKYDGAEALNVFYRSSGSAFKNTSYVNEALLGTEEGDLAGVIKNFDRVVVGLNRDEAALQGTVTNLRIVTGSFAAEDEALRQSIATLPDVLDASQPAYANLNDAFPPLRAFAREALPGVRSTPETLRATQPLIDQVRGLVSPSELRGLVADLRPAVPELAQLARSSVPLFNQGRLFSSCLNETITPTSYNSVEPPEGGTFGSTQPPTGNDGQPYTTLEEATAGIEGLSGESRSGDANGQYIKVAPAIGTNSVKLIPNQDLPLGELDPEAEDFFGLAPSELLGLAPGPLDAAKTPFRPDVRCETNDPPNLESGRVTVPGTQSPISTAGGVNANSNPEAAEALDGLLGLAEDQKQLEKLREDGEDKEADQLQKELDERVDEIMEYQADSDSDADEPKVGG
ncbi:MCE family protein [Thermoleophilia bacterium SCSIO 60948]|nr:MCE family protein [Thermoleophilia bacterium SCSIO 60948]